MGARPQFIKCAPLSRELRKTQDEILVHTGQHYDREMSATFFNELGIPEPDYNLGIGSDNHGAQTGKMLIEIERLLLKERPDMVIVYGDTNSTLAGAVAAAKLHIPVAHVEAGLRSFDKLMPEELNRILTDHSSDLLLCPTQTAVDNLSKEGITNHVYLVGDVMVDAIEYNHKIAETESKILEKLDLNSKNYLVITMHRPSNTDNQENLKSVIDALGICQDTVVFPVHPRTEKCLRNAGLWENIPENVRVIKPIGYLDMIRLLKNAKKLLTDSGGMQKEAYVLGVPCITLRENTEWVETLRVGWNVLVGADKVKIIDAVRKFNPTGEQREIFKRNASKKIREIIEAY